MNGMNGADRVGDLAALRRDVPPARDLWPAIESGIRAGAAASAPAAAGSRRQSMPWALGVAAGFVLLASGIWIGRVLLPAAPATPAAAAVAPAQGGAQWAAFDPGASYEAARAAELAQLPARLAALPQPTRDQVRSSLETLERSIAEIRGALGREPANALLQSLLIDTYQEEMRVLTTLNAAASAAEEI